jgi:putative SOS response-associated peptidase YedK
VCGRFSLIVSARLLAELFDLEGIAQLEPRYNIAPTQSINIVRESDDKRREWAVAHWGLIPSWAKDPSIGHRMINARAETAHEKPAFRSAVRHRRCLIPADGFFEWRSEDGAKQPYYIHFSDSRPFAFAGLWERWQPPQGPSVDSCTILTTSANALVEQLHHRMPVILDPSDYGEWLSNKPLAVDRLHALLVPHPPEPMECYPVSTVVNRPANNDPECVRPVA